MIENISHKKKIIAKIIRSNYQKKSGITFFTKNSLSQQVAFMSHPKKYIIQPHIHKRNLKKIYDTCEVLIILSGKLKVNFYNNKKKFLLSKTLSKNDIIILLSAGHGFEIIKNCKFIEVKQGPYNAKKDKLKF